MNHKLQLLSVALCGPASLMAQQRPNVIVIMSDDQAWGDLGYTGNLTVRTPNLDRLAGEGAFFENFYVCPLSSPTRAEFLTGRYYPRCGVRGAVEGTERVDTDEKTIAEYFQEAGYATGCFGKWHSGLQYPYHPNARGFEEFYGFCSGHWGSNWEPILEHNGKIVKGEGFSIDDYTSHALSFIKENKDNPFFVFLPYNTPHTPIQMPDYWWNRIKDRELKQKGGVQKYKMENEDFTKGVLALAENIDWNVGRVNDCLAELGIEENTIVIYFSDNGPLNNSRTGDRWNTDMIGWKCSVSEGGVRSPLCMRWTGHIAPKKVRQLSGVVDFLPTLLGMSDIRYESERPLDGVNLSKQILKDAKEDLNRTIFSTWNKKTALRQGHYLLDDRNRLFRTDIDRGEKNDLSKAEPKVYARMVKIKEKLCNDVLPEFKGEDLRPYTVGHPDEYSSKLAGGDALLSGGVRRSGAPNCSYFTDWRSTDGVITWNIDVLEEGDFEVVLHYTLDEHNVGSKVRMYTDRPEESLVFTLTQPNNAPAIGIDLDRFDRHEMSFLKGFKPFNVGRIHLAQGRTQLKIQALEIPDFEVMDLWLVELRRIK